MLSSLHFNSGLEICDENRQESSEYFERTWQVFKINPEIKFSLKCTKILMEQLQVTRHAGLLNRKIEISPLRP